MTGGVGSGTPLFALPRITAVGGRNGVVLLRSAEPLGEYPVSAVHSVREHARLTPDHPMIAERDGGDWRRVTCRLGSRSWCLRSKRTRTSRAGSSPGCG